MFSFQKKNTGFTLIEILVAMSIFVIVMLTIGGIFVSITKTQRKSSIEQRVQAEARYALELLTQEIKGGEIDYNAYGGALGSNLQTILNLIRPNGDNVQFRLGDNTLKMRVGGSDQNVLSSDVKVENLQFYITPLASPFDFGAGVPNEQPRVTISFTVKEAKTTAKAEEKSEMKVQTTVSSRIYRR